MSASMTEIAPIVPINTGAVRIEGHAGGDSPALGAGAKGCARKLRFDAMRRREHDDLAVEHGGGKVRRVCGGDRRRDEECDSLHRISCQVD